MLPENHHCPSIISEKAAAGWFGDGDREVLIGEQVSEDEEELDDSDATGSIGDESEPEADRQEESEEHGESSDGGSTDRKSEPGTDEEGCDEEPTTASPEREEIDRSDYKDTESGSVDGVSRAGQFRRISTLNIKKGGSKLKIALLRLLDRLGAVVRSALRRIWRGVRMVLRAGAVVVIWASAAWGAWLWLNDAPVPQLAGVVLAGVGGYTLLKLTNFSS